MSNIVLDSSAFLAYLWREPGGERVAEVLNDGAVAMSAVNITEVITRAIDRGLPEPLADEMVASLDFEQVAFDAEMALRVAKLRSVTRAYGLSLGDRACLVLAQSRDALAITADRMWSALDIGVCIECVR